MRRISSEVLIAAQPERVWDVLTDFERFHEWNPFVIEAEGRAVVGERLRLRIRPPGGKEMVFRPTVRASVPGQLLRWRGRLVLPGIFDGLHSFALGAEDGGTRVVQSEDFSGLLVPLTGSVLERTEQGFAQLNEALRQRVEQGAPQGG